MTHELKILTKYFVMIKYGVKNFEIRSEKDRHFEIGDKLILKEWDGNNYTGDSVTKTVIYVLRKDSDVELGLKDGYCILGLNA